MDPGSVGGTRHPQVLIDGGGGDNTAVDGRSFPVTVRYGDPNQNPTHESKEQSNDFYYGVHVWLCPGNPDVIIAYIFQKT